MDDNNDEEFSISENIHNIFGSDSDVEENNLPSNKECFSTRRDIWNPQTTKLLITTRLAMEKNFNEGKKNKNVLWNKCLFEMRKSLPDIKISVVDVRKKFNNLIVTFNRIKKRKEKSGRGAIFWKYFEQFDAVYGVRHNIVPPKGLLFDLSPTAVDNSLNETNSYAENFGNETSSIPKDCASTRKSKKGANAEILEYLEKQDEKDEIRHQEIMKLEKDKHEIEKEKISCLREMLAILNK